MSISPGLILGILRYVITFHLSHNMVSFAVTNHLTTLLDCYNLPTVPQKLATSPKDVCSQSFNLIAAPKSPNLMIPLEERKMFAPTMNIIKLLSNILHEQYIAQTITLRYRKKIKMHNRML